MSDAIRIVGMTRLLAPRGPDGEGYWLGGIPAEAGALYSGPDSPPPVRAQYPSWQSAAAMPHKIAFGHRRYAVATRHPEGHQPMQCGACTLIYNGELYNYRALRQELAGAGYLFTTDSDTEVVLQAYRHWGLDCLSRFRGFFAFAMYDADTQQVVLARDPLGKAPLYLLQQGSDLYFASDIKSLLHACPDARARVNTLAVEDYLYEGTRDRGHQTFWRDIRSVPNGSWLQWDVQTGTTRSGTYWRLPDTRQSSAELPFEVALSQFRALLAQAVGRRMRAELPIGLTLSGGLDSSAIAALCAQQAQPGKVPVFTVYYQRPQDDERAFARAVVRRYPTQLEHHFIDGGAHTLSEAWDSFMDQQEEPFHDPVLYTDFYQQQCLKRAGIGVNLNGAGADELLAGYPVYLWAQLQEMKGLTYNRFATFCALLYNIRPEQVQQRLRLRRPPPAFLRPPVARTQAGQADLETLLRQKMSDHTLHYWLRSMHKHCMQVPVEPRLPFLDADLVDFCMRLPTEYLLHKGWTKYILRKAVENLLPPEVVWRRRKMGFPFDTIRWMREEMPAHRAMLSAAGENPWFSGPVVARHYEALLKQRPGLLWRLLCFGYWWNKHIF